MSWSGIYKSFSTVGAVFERRETTRAKRAHRKTATFDDPRRSRRFASFSASSSRRKCSRRRNPKDGFLDAWIGSFPSTRRLGGDCGRRSRPRRASACRRRSRRPSPRNCRPRKSKELSPWIEGLFSEARDVEVKARVASGSRGLASRAGRCRARQGVPRVEGARRRRIVRGGPPIDENLGSRPAPTRRSSRSSTSAFVV